MARARVNRANSKMAAGDKTRRGAELWRVYYMYRLLNVQTKARKLAVVTIWYASAEKDDIGIMHKKEVVQRLTAQLNPNNQLISCTMEKKQIEGAKKEELASQKVSMRQ